MIKAIKRKVNLTGGEDLQWFLGVAVYRDRKEKKTWLSQASYCAKIAKKAETEQKAYTPMTREELFPRLDRATLKETVRIVRHVLVDSQTW